MCGIAGFVDRGGLERDANVDLTKMTEAIRHRGPDREGHWYDETAGVALGFRRLSILDLSPRGDQPMQSTSGRYVMVFNGEVYNHHDLRDDLATAGCTFRGHSDTEVMLACIERDGVEHAVGSFVGMFAFALYDREDRKLHLVRDRLGEKPLFFGSMNGRFLFGSELKALRANSAWDGSVDPTVLAAFLRHNYVPAPHSIYEGIRKVRPGTIVTCAVDDDGMSPQEHVYWSAARTAEAGVESPLRGSMAEVTELLDQTLRTTLANEMIADVPLGAFLSGGVDSSLIVALMQAQSNRQVQTFTIGFQEQEFDEAVHARRVAKHLGTDHTELMLTPDETLAIVPDLPAVFDEPFADSSQIPMILVSKLARKSVTVALSGDGGDELFGGYSRYAVGERLWKTKARLPNGLLRLVGRTVRSISPPKWDAVLGRLSIAAPSGFKGSVTGDRLHKTAALLSDDTLDAMYRRLVSHWPDPTTVVHAATEAATSLTQFQRNGSVQEPYSRMMLLDTISYLPDDILVKVDRSTMSVSLEARAPFLDHRIVELGWRIPLEMKVRNGVGKYIVRQVLDRYVPRSLIDRPKMGFGIPVGAWLRGPLESWAGDLLGEDRLKRDGFFDPEQISKKWQEHRTGKRDWHYLLWDVLMFNAWLEAQV